MLLQTFYPLLTKELEIHLKLFQKQYTNLILKEVLIYKKGKTPKKWSTAPNDLPTRRPWIVMFVYQLILIIYTD